jgi:hypothetical protein
METNKLSRWYGFIKSQPCVVCGREPTKLNPNQADHIDFISERHGNFAKRNHNRGAWHCLPLCPTCHTEKTMSRELDFYAEKVGANKAYAILSMLLTRFIKEVLS